MIVADLWDRGIDLQAPQVRYGRTWPWLLLQVEGLLTVAPQIVFDRWGNRYAVPQTRLGLALQPPQWHGPPSRAADQSWDD